MKGKEALALLWEHLGKNNKLPGRGRRRLELVSVFSWDWREDWESAFPPTVAQTGQRAVGGACQGLERRGSRFDLGEVQKFGRVLWGVKRDSVRDERGLQAAGETELGLAGPVVCVVIRVQLRLRDTPGPGQADGLQTKLFIIHFGENTLYIKLNIVSEL